MNLHKLKIVVAVICVSLMFVQCADDDENGNIIGQVTCEDGEMNGDEEGIDCGGSACEPCAVAADFSGTFVQEDIMGRPGITTVFGGEDAVKNDFNNSIVSDRMTFQPLFEARLEFYHDVYGAALGVDLDYETNILALDAPTFTTVLAQFDALQVAPNAPTTYFDGTNVLTGRNLSDDVIDISLTLMFGGTSGTRFDGSDTDGDGVPDTPQLTSDGVDAGDRDFTLPFPYLEGPNQ